jgi:hypothetical protein
MGHAFQTSDEQYAKLAAYAAERGQTPETLFQEWVSIITRDTEKLPSVSNVKPTNHERQAEREEALLNSPLFQIAGMFAIGEQGWADRHDEYLAETYLENHADSK